ncbi:hypothetical protein CHH28_18270 [Bacterioplanes sanyensis]|uniref:microbial collagenase n=1 Tax=Bacterioplanes sanyensis TaxID=1249553 RepID=A0A222FPQ0_9GAMM|nr:collagenase [Bacterioplanes sanyensis]ASP40494.1 hypothetical protein CHH28_18270 [Bacterioplanes sanyensis]
MSRIWLSILITTLLTACGGGSSGSDRSGDTDQDTITQPERGNDSGGSGADNSGSDNSGSDNSGSDNSGSDNSGSDNSGSDNSGSDNSGSDNSGSDNSGSDNSGSDNSGSDNSGSDNSGSDNSGSDNSGSDNSGSDNSGSGNDDSGNDDSGNDDSGNDDSGNDDSGNDDSGNDDSGNDDSGNDDSGNDDSGNDDSGNDDSGNDDSGNDDSGNDDSGNDDSGNDDSGNDDSGNDDGSTFNGVAHSWDCKAASLDAFSDEDFAATVAAAENQCVNGLFSLTGPQAAKTFAQPRMEIVAKHIAGSSSPSEASVLFLRAGLYVQYYHKNDVGDYTPTLREAIKQSLNKLLSDTRITGKADSLLSESVTLIDSSGLNTQFIEKVIQILEFFPNSDTDSRDRKVATNNVFTVLFRGHYQDDFVSDVNKTQALLSALVTFVNQQQALLQGDDAYLVENALREYARFLQHDALKPQLRTQIKTWLQQLPEFGGAWLALAKVAQSYDDCREYGICNFQKNLEQTVLAIRHSCANVSADIRAQALTQPQRVEVCNILADQSQRFHQLFNTGQQPVADDYNDRLEVVIFDSSSDYKRYAGLFFDISTDNGGMYLEGNPAQQGNQARFIAYRAEWQDDFTVWNLRHEYTHYLDGRYNLYGTFTRSQAFPTTWWTEGMAEYATHLDKNPAAIDSAKRQKVALSEVLQNTYSDGTERVYRWGYLASWYMKTEQAARTLQWLTAMRENRFEDYQRDLEQLGNAYDASFSTWLDQRIAEHDQNGGNDDTDGDHGDDGHSPHENQLIADEPRRISTTGQNYYFILVPDNARHLRIYTQGGSGNVTLYSSTDTWPTASNHQQQVDGQGTSSTLFIDQPQAGYLFLQVAGDYQDVDISFSFNQSQSASRSW